MDKFYKKLLDLSKSNITIQKKMKDRMHDRQLLNKVKGIIDQKKMDAKSNIYSQVNTARVWVEEVTGLDKVHAAQNEVFQYQNEFIKSQNKRRELGAKLTSLQIELNDLHNDIVTTNRSEEKYLNLITREHKLLKLENQLRNDFALAEAEERENFTRFTTKIKESQDKEREQASRTKYWTIGVSSAFTVIGVLGNGIISFLKMHKIDNTILQLGEETQMLSQNIHSDVSQLDRNQSLMLQLLTQDQNGSRKESIDRTSLEPLQQTLKQLMVFTTQNTEKTKSQLSSLTANQTAVMNSLKQISNELDRLNTSQKEMRNEFLVEKKKIDQLFRMNPNTSVIMSDQPAPSSMGTIYDKASSLGNGVKQALSDGYRNMEDYRISGDIVKKQSIETDYSSSGSSIGWKKPLVYFGIFSAVYILATSGLLF
ncbi:hypothetical protein WDU94_002920 [Cyamophila willieti]